MDADSRPPNRSRRRFRLAITLLALALSPVLAEVVHRCQRRFDGSSFRRADIEAEIRSLLDATKRVGPDPRQADGEDPGAWGEILHPFLGFDTRASLDRIARDRSHFQRAKDPRSFELLVLGSSVAAGFANNVADILIEDLKRDERFRELEFRVMNYGRGSFKQPQQAIYLAYLLSMGIRPDAVICIDGFNELAQSNVNRQLGAHPIYPSIAQWAPFAQGGLDDRRSLDLLLDLRNRERRLRELAGRALGSPLLYSSIGSHWWLGRLRRESAATLDAQHAFLEWAGTGRVSPASKGPPFQGGTQEFLETCITAWSEGARMLDAVCDRHSIFYLGVLQPSLHDPGAKVVTDEERANGRPSPEWREAVELGYPMLREASGRLQDEGVVLLDATRIFADFDRTLYIDGCHLNREGLTILARAVASTFLAAYPAD